MALEDTSEVERAYSKKQVGYPLVFILFDHWEWNEPNERFAYCWYSGDRTLVATQHDFVHMLYFREKMFTHIAYIEEGYVEDDYGSDRSKGCVIRYEPVFEPGARAKWFLNLMKFLCEKHAIAFECELAAGADFDKLRASAAAYQRMRAAVKALPRDCDVPKYFIEADEMRAKDLSWSYEYPPDFRRFWPLKGAREKPVDADAPVPPLPGDVSAITVYVDDMCVEMTVGDDFEWDDDESDPWALAPLDQTSARVHEFMHLYAVWDNIKDCLWAWNAKQVAGLESWTYQYKLTFVLVLTYPLSNRGKWFMDWLRGFLDLIGCGFRLELAATEEAHNRRQDSERRRATRQAGKSAVD